MLYPTELRASWMTIGRARTFSRFIRMAPQRSRCSLRPAWSSARNTKVRTCASAATLIARCRSHTTDAYIAWGACMDTDDACVTVRTTGGTSQIGVFGLSPSVLTDEPPFDTFAFVGRCTVRSTPFWATSTPYPTTYRTPRTTDQLNRPLTYTFTYPMTYKTPIQHATEAIQSPTGAPSWCIVYTRSRTGHRHLL